MAELEHVCHQKEGIRRNLAFNLSILGHFSKGVRRMSVENTTLEHT